MVQIPSKSHWTPPQRHPAQDLPGRGSDVLALGRRGEGLQQLLAAQVLSQNVAALGAARNAQVQMGTEDPYGADFWEMLEEKHDISG